MPKPDGIPIPVRVTANASTGLAPGVEPTVKVHYGRLGRFLPRSQLPPFEGVEAWFMMKPDRRGRFVFYEQVERPTFLVPLRRPDDDAPSGV